MAEQPLTEVQILELECDRLRIRLKRAEEQARVERTIWKNLQAEKNSDINDLFVDQQLLEEDLKRLKDEHKLLVDGVNHMRDRVEKECPIVTKGTTGRHYTEVVDRMCKAYIRLEESYEALKTVKNPTPPPTMELRDLFAASALSGFSRGQYVDLAWSENQSIAKLAYHMADKMMEVRKTT